MSSNDKLAIHTVPSVTKAGFECLRWRSWVIFAGSNPLGPRGGRNGKVVAGRRVAGACRSYAEAAEHIKSTHDLAGLEVV